MSSAADVKLAYGEAPDGRMVFIADVPSGKACGMACPGCGEPLWAKKGPVIAHHFAHEGDSNCVAAYETMMHKLAKQIIAEDKRIWLPPLEARVGDLSKQIYPGMWFNFDHVETEVWQDGIRPDIVAYKGERALAIEMFVTHACGQEKIALVQERGTAMIEIDLSDVPRDAEVATITAAVLKNAPRRWLFNAKLIYVQNELLREIAERPASSPSINPEKMATSPFDSVIVSNIVITSRYQKAHEFDLMARVVSGLSKYMTYKIMKMFCDSSQGSSFIVTMHKDYESLVHAQPVADELVRLLLKEHGGYSGLYVGSLVLEPYWECDDEI